MPLSLSAWNTIAFFIDPAFVAIHLSYSNGEGESLASLDLGMYYGILKNMDHDFRLGGFLSARYAPLESLSAGEDDFEIIPGLMVAALYEFSISKTLGRRRTFIRTILRRPAPSAGWWGPF
jgi:hypothetical protein